MKMKGVIVNPMTNHIKEKTLEEFELDSTAHSQGRCSFSLTSLCIAEEHKVKSFLSQKLDEYAMEIVKECLPEELDPKTYENPLGLHGADDEYVDAGVIQGHNSARAQMLEKAKEILNVK